MKTATKPQEATALLRADHQKVSKLFAEYEHAKTKAKMKGIVSQICTELSVYAQVRAQIPGARDSQGADCHVHAVIE